MWSDHHWQLLSLPHNAIWPPLTVINILNKQIKFVCRCTAIKGKERKMVFIWFLLSKHTYWQSAQACITQFYLQTTPCLPFLRKHSPDGATTTEAEDIQLQLTTHLLTPKGWKAELAWLVDLQRMVYPRKWSPISYTSSTGQGKFAGQRPTFYHCATWPTILTDVCDRKTVNTNYQLCGRGFVNEHVCWTSAILLNHQASHHPWHPSPH